MTVLLLLLVPFSAILNVSITSLHYHCNNNIRELHFVVYYTVYFVSGFPQPLRSGLALPKVCAPDKATISCLTKQPRLSENENKSSLTWTENGKKSKSPCHLVPFCRIHLSNDQLVKEVQHLNISIFHLVISIVHNKIWNKLIEAVKQTMERLVNQGVFLLLDTVQVLRHQLSHISSGFQDHQPPEVKSRVSNKVLKTNIVSC